MNRRDFLKRTLAVSAAGLLVPVAEPIRKVWALDRTMVRSPFADLPVRENPGPVLTLDGRGGKPLEGDPFFCVTDSQGVTYTYSAYPAGPWIRELHTDGYWRDHVFMGREWLEIKKNNEDRPIPDVVLTARNDPTCAGTFVVVDGGRSFLQQRVIVSDDGTMIATP